jgi:RHS repeat-associated protein
VSGSFNYMYDAFGLIIEQTGTTANNYLYRGEQYDHDLHLYYQRARYLNAETGRFWTQDTYEGSPGSPASLQKYLYANGDQVGGWDPSGHLSMPELLLTITIASLLSPGYVNAPGPLDPTYGGDPLGVEMMANLVGGELIGKYILSPAIGFLSRTFQYTTARVGNVLFAKNAAPPASATGHLLLIRQIDSTH